MSLVTVVDNRAMFGPARDQGPRPTCLAFAASDCHSAAKRLKEELSPEFAYFHAQAHTGRAYDNGATIIGMQFALQAKGQPIESFWPYHPGQLAASLWHPPQGTPQLFRHELLTAAFDYAGIISHLKRGENCILILALSDAFYSPDVNGVVDQLPGEIPDHSRMHAVIATGFGATNQGDALMVRNSWGRGWGLDGYAWLTEAFLRPRLVQTLKMGGSL